MLHDISTRKHRTQPARTRCAAAQPDHIPGAIYKVLLPVHGEPQLLYVSTRAAELYEVDPAGSHLNWTTHYKRVTPTTCTWSRRLVEASLQHQSQPVQYEYRIIHPTQGLRWLSGEAMARLCGRQHSLVRLYLGHHRAASSTRDHHHGVADRHPPGPTAACAPVEPPLVLRPRPNPAPNTVRPIRVLYAEDKRNQRAVGGAGLQDAPPSGNWSSRH